jgi:hypothetical protein
MNTANGLEARKRDQLQSMRALICVVLTVFAGHTAVAQQAGAQQAGAQQTRADAPQAASRVAVMASGVPAALVAAAAPAAKAVAPAEPQEAGAQPAKAGGEGIKVHGHWLIDVKNPDGKFVSHTEFDNALVTPNAADVFLSQLLAGTMAMSGWQIAVNSSTSTALCPGQGYYSNLNSCFIVQAAYNSSISNNPLVTFEQCYFINCFGGMTITVVPYNATTHAASYFQLQGSFSPTAAGPITSVSTIVVGCLSTTVNIYSNATCAMTSPADAADGYSGTPGSTSYQSPYFTSTTLPTPIVLIAGQVVTVTVQISFS